MKNKYILLILCMLFTVSLVTAAEWDNTYSYDEENKTVTITNLFGLGEDIAKIKLNTPVNNYVPIGFNKVAEYTIATKKDFVGVFNDLKFYNMKRNKEEFTRDYELKYQVFEKIKVDDYELDCNLVTNVTHTNFNQCIEIKTGNHEELREAWEDFVTYDVIEGSIITVGIFTEVQSGDIIDWVPTLYGKEIKEWAIWTAALNVSLLAHYSLDESSGTVLDRTGRNDGTNNGATPNVEGKINTAYNFDQSIPDYIDLLIRSINVTSEPITINAWVNADSFQIGNQIFSANAANGYSFSINSSGNLNFGKFGISEVVSDLVSITSNDWYMVSVIYNNTGANFYVNGTYYDTKTYSVTFDSVAYHIGSTVSGSDYAFNGTIDEVSVWNRSLSSAEISQLWNSGDGLEWGILPFVKLNTPVENYNTSINTITFNCSATDNVGVQNISLFIDNILNTTVTGGLGQNLSLETTETLTFDNHNWTCDTYNTNNLYNTTVTRNLTINTSIDIKLNTPVENYNTSINAITFNCSATDHIGVQNISLFIDNILNTTETGGISQNISFETIISLGDGSHNWTCEAYDIFSNINTTEIRNLTVDSTAPIINIISPLVDVLTTTDPYEILFNVSIFENGLGLQSCVYYNTTVNVSVACGTNATLSLSGGEYTLSYWANDTLGNMGVNSTTFEINVYNYTTHYITPVIEGDIHTIYFNLTATNVTSALANISYNNTLGTMTIDSSNSTNIVFSNITTSPQVNADSLINFSIFSSLNGQFLAYTNYSQTVRNLSLLNCTGGSNIIANFTLVDEKEQTWLDNSVIETAVQFYNPSRTTHLFNLSLSTTSNPFALCLNTTLVSISNYSLDVLVKYLSLGYATEYYHIENFRLTEDTEIQNITLYDLNSSDTTEFQLTFTGDDYLPVEGALVYVDRQYIPENKFKTVEVPKTDSNGQSLLHLVRNEIIYNIRVIKNGVLLGTFNNIIAFCEDFTIGDCKINLNSADSNANLFIYDNEVGITFTPPSYNSTSEIISFIFASIDGTSKTVNMSVTRESIIGNRSVCSDLVTAVSGTLTCDISGVGDSTVRTNIYVEGDLTLVKQISLTGTNLGVAGYLVMFMMALTFILLFSGSKTGVLMGVILTFAGAIGLGMITGSLIGVGASGLWLILICIIGIYKLNKDKPQ